MVVDVIPRKAFTDHSRWWIFRAIWWYAIPPSAPGLYRVEAARAFNTYEEAIAHYLSKAVA